MVIKTPWNDNEWNDNIKYQQQQLRDTDEMCMNEWQLVLWHIECILNHVQYM